MAQGCNFTFESCQCFDLEGISGNGVPVKRLFWGNMNSPLCHWLVGDGHHLFGMLHILNSQYGYLLDPWWFWTSLWVCYSPSSEPGPSIPSHLAYIGDWGCVVIPHSSPPGCPPLYFLQAFGLQLGMWVPHWGTVLEEWSYNHLVCCFIKLAAIHLRNSL